MIILGPTGPHPPCRTSIYPVTRRMAFTLIHAMPTGTIIRMALVGPLWFLVAMAAGAETTTADL